MSDANGERIGHIRLVEPLGEGGMGTVWAGFDDKLRREVAVKTLHGERFDIETRAHLLAEARILSQLDHSGICRVYDYLEGEDSDYLVLERIHGETLRKAVERQSFSIAARLRIAQKIAEALAVAHARGVVHRDLKPSNVMLTDGDERDSESNGREVKVLDFGLAHSTHRPASLISSFQTGARREPPTADGTLTRFASLLLESDTGTVTGTPANMSPEQARGEPPTPASDLYSFGLLLQELFTGSTAYPSGLSVDLLLVKAADGDTLPVQGIDRDIKALIEDLLDVTPEKRPTAAAAAARIERIRQRPIRRRRVAAAVSLSVLAFVAIVKYTMDLQRERQEAQAVADFLTDMFGAFDVWTARDGELTMQGFLDQGAARIDELGDQPAVQARLLHTLGTVYRSLNQYDKARPALERALEIRRKLHGDEHVEIAETLFELGVLLMDMWDFDAAEAPVMESLALRRRLLPDHPDLADSLNLAGAWHGAVGDQRASVDLNRESLAMWERLEDKPEDHGKMIVNLADVLIDQREIEEAESVLRQGLASRRQLAIDLDTQLTMIARVLAELLMERGLLDESESLYREALDIRRRAMGADHNATAFVQAGLGDLLRHRGDLETAQSVLREAVEIAQQDVGEDHCATVFPLVRWVEALIDRHELEEAETALRKAQEVAPTCGTMFEADLQYEAGRLCRARGDLPCAEQRIRRALASWGEVHSMDHWHQHEAEGVLGEILSELGRSEEAEPWLLKGHEGYLDFLGADAPHTREALLRLVSFFETRQPERAAEYRSRLVAKED